MKKLLLTAFGALLAVGCAGSAKLSESQEYYVGRAVAAQSVAKDPIYEQENIYEYVAKVGWTIALASDRPEVFLGYNFLVLESKDVGAWAAPSGFVFVTTGALALMENEDQLAAVLAHEIAHVNLKHPEEVAQDAAKKAGVMDILSKAGAIAAVFFQEHADDIGKLVEGLSSVVDDLGERINAGYGREYEMAADKLAVDILTRSEVGYNPTALADFLARLPRREGAAAQGPYATHPGVDERIETVRKLAESAAAVPPTAPERTKRFKEMTARLRP